MTKRSIPTEATSESEGFLGRWSRQKSRNTASEQPEAALEDSIVEPVVDLPPAASDGLGELATVEVEHDNETDTASDEPEEVLLTDADMPPIESLDSKSDVSMFLNKGVSEALRKAAFRRLFSLPAYNIRDGLNDYDEDYTYFEPLGNTVTSDMKFHELRKERERLAREAELAEAERLEAERELQNSESEQLEEEAIDDEVAAESDGIEGEVTDDTPDSPWDDVGMEDRLTEESATTTHDEASDDVNVVAHPLPHT